MSLFSVVIYCIDGRYLACLQLPGRLTAPIFPPLCPANKPRITYIHCHDMISLALQGMCDNKAWFLDVSTGFPSRIHDGRVFKLSYISKRLPLLCDSGRYHPLGNTAYPCREYLLTSYKDYGNLAADPATFITQLSSTRVLTENDFVILKNSVRQLKALEFCSVETTCKFLIPCYVIHNPFQVVANVSTTIADRDLVRLPRQLPKCFWFLIWGNKHYCIV